MYKKINYMAYTDFIAAIDLGTSRIVGMVGKKNEYGVLSIIAYEVETSASCIRRGCVYNVEETANKIKRLILKLENKLNGTKIAKVYVGIGGQSLRSVDHTVPKILGTDGVVTDEIIKSLHAECLSYHPDMQDVLAAVSPVYYLDDKPEANPVGIPCTRIEARYKLIVGRPSLKRHVINSISERAQIKIAGIIVSPLALGDAVLSDDERDLGSALIGFGAGVTTLTVYKGGNLVHLSVIPMGSNLITRDITTLHLLESEAERVKQTYGSAMMDQENDQSIQVSLADGLGMREIKLSDLNNVIEARMGEILENVYARLESIGLEGNLGAGIVITGGGAALKSLPEVIRKRMKMEVRYSATRRGIVASGDLEAGNPSYAVAVGLLMHGTENCAGYVPPKYVSESEHAIFEEEEVFVAAPPVEKVSKPASKPAPASKPKGVGLFKGLSNKFDTMTKNLFDDSEDKS